MNPPDLIGPILNREPETTQSHKAILWGQDDLLAHAIGSFLKSRAWEVVRVAESPDVSGLIREVRQTDAEVVVLCRHQADQSALALQLIGQRPCLKVIILGLDSNLIQIFSKQDIILQGASELLFIFESGHFPNCISGKEAGDPEKT